MGERDGSLEDVVSDMVAESTNKSPATRNSAHPGPQPEAPTHRLFR
jgi:hypothetical protein